MENPSSQSDDNHELRDRTCEYCAEVFVLRRSDQRFCSDSCRLRNWRSRRKPPGRTAVLLAEIEQLRHQVAELERTNDSLRRAIGRTESC